MRDVAQRAGVSPQTVSRALRGSGAVAPHTRARVRAAMEELGYLGNEAAGALKRGQTYIIGLLCPVLTLPFWSDVAAGAEAQAHARGYSLLLCDTSDSLEKEAGYLSLLLSHRVAGIIYVLPRCRPDRHAACASLLRARVPVVVISSDLDDLPAPHVRTDDTRAGYVAVRHLLNLGRRHIALVSTTHAAAGAALSAGAADVDRLVGARAALGEAQIAPEATPLFLVPDTIAGGRTAGEALLARGAPWPDGVFATTDAIALGFLEVMRAHALRVPDDIALVAHDGLLESSMAVPSLTTVAPPRWDMGRTCVDLVLRARAGETLPQVEVLEAIFTARESTLGAGLAQRQGMRAPLSDPSAWARWREWRAPPGPAPATAPVSCLTLATLDLREEVMQPG
jgi:LacI family transcriptional regulator